MPRRFIDLSVSVDNDIASDPPIMLLEIDHMTHDQTAGQMIDFFPGLKKRICRGAKAGSRKAEYFYP